MDLFGIYGSRDDSEHEQEHAEDQPDTTDAEAGDPGRQAGADHPEDDAEITVPLGLVGTDADPTPERVPQQHDDAQSARDEQIARYVDEIGLVDVRKRLVRPYATTGGRTYSGTDLGLETMIVTTDRGHGVRKHDHRLVAELCGQPTSVAEVAAHTSMPIGVARVVIADMIELGFAVVCSTQEVGNAPSVRLMNRVLEGLRRL